MTQKTRLIGISCVSGFFLLLDQSLKYVARTSPDYTWYVIKPWLGWEYFQNSGIAFSLPVPNWLILLVTPFVLFALCILLQKVIHKSLPQSTGLIFIMAGAVSNYIDRVLFGVTIDYVRLLTAVINLGDVLIVGGLLLLLLAKKK
jgi:signal peptidase II